MHKIQDKERHLLEECSYRMVRCSNLYFGCNKFILSKDLETHESKIK